MKIKKELVILGVALLSASGNCSLHAFGGGGGPGQGDYPAEPTGFIPDAEWPAKDKTGMTVINDWRTQEETKTYGTPRPVPVLQKKDINEDLLNELEQRIMKDIEATLAKKKKTTPTGKKPSKISSLRADSSKIETDIKDNASAVEAELRNEL